MPRIGGSEAYYYEIQLEMDREDTDMRTAEIEILIGLSRPCASRRARRTRRSKNT